MEERDVAVESCFMDEELNEKLSGEYSVSRPETLVHMPLLSCQKVKD